MDNESTIGICDYDPKALLVFYVSKRVPTSDRGRFYAFGRVFSGPVLTSAKYHIQGPNYLPGDLFVETAQRIVLMIVRSDEAIKDCPASDTIGLAGVDQILLKSGMNAA